MQLLKINWKNMVGASRFERPTSCSQGRRANQAALRPDRTQIRNSNTETLNNFKILILQVQISIFGR